MATMRKRLKRSPSREILRNVWDFFLDNKLWSYVKHHNEGAFTVLREVKKVMIPPVRRFKICHPLSFGGSTWRMPWIIQIDNAGLFWKDKYDTPRFEGDSGSLFGPSPRISVTLFACLRMIFWWEAPCDWKDEDTYWEMFLWYKHYCNNDINKARETWPWEDMEEKSTWKEEFVLPERRNS